MTELKIDVDSEMADLITIANLREARELYRKSSDDELTIFASTMFAFDVVIEYFGG